MSKYKIDISYPEEEMQKNKLRFDSLKEFKYYDRPAVYFGVYSRYFLEIFGINYDDYFRDAESHFKWQLEFQKWAIENIPDDRCQSKTIKVAVNFECIHNSAGFGAPAKFSSNNPPRVEEFLRTPEEADNWEAPGIDTGFWKLIREWYRNFNGLAKETEVTFNGKSGEIAVAPLSIETIGPFMCAVEMVGTQFYEWLYCYPDVCHRLLDKITTALIETEEKFREIDPAPRLSYGLVEDDAGNISEEMFRKFSVPYDLRLYSKFGEGLKDGRSMHNCGRSDHLHDLYMNELKMSTFAYYGYSVKPERAAEKLAGKCYLWGNIDPVLLASEDKEAITEYTRKYLDILAPYGGLVLCEGANVIPGTPIENMELVVRVAEEYAKDYPELFTYDRH